jgi:glycosidase
MKKILSPISVYGIVIALFVLMFAACTSTDGNIKLPVSTATLLVPATTTASATPLPPTATSIPSTTPTTIPSPTPTQVPVSLPWWKDTVFYELTVRSFYDSNSDGIGDFNGLIEKLDYLNDGDPSTTTDLGVTGIWLLPIHPSPSNHGYDVTDYYAVNPQYGTMDDFRRLVDAAHRRGIRIITDLVINHSSSQHPWFIQSQDPQSPYRNWYIWSDEDPGFMGVWGQQVWHPWNGDFYYAFFWEGMPDLNFTNPEVTAEMEQITRFWLTDIGIDGFRLDAIGSLIEEGTVTVETKASHEWFASYFKFYKAIKPNAMTIGEVWREDAVVAPWVTNQQVDLAFEFDLSAALIASVNEGNTSRILETLRAGTSQFPTGQYGIFLANHDMTRVITQLGNQPQKARVAASLYLTLPGVPFVYYGEEIGMRNQPPDKLLLPPMQWTGERYVGFSDVAPWSEVYVDPLSNVSAETGDPNSILSHYRTLISLRNRYPALRTGELFLLSTSAQGLFACLRTSPTESMLILVNLSASPIPEPKLSLEAGPLSQGEYAPTTLISDTRLASLTVLDNGRISDYIPAPVIPPYATIVMLLQSK